MIPYIEEYGLDQARKEARRWWESKKKIEAKATLAPIQTSANVGKRAAPDVFTRIKNRLSSTRREDMTEGEMMTQIGEAAIERKHCLDKMS